MAIQMVKCKDCSLSCDIQQRNGMGDGYCPHAYRTLVGYFNNHKTAEQPRRCSSFAYSKVYAEEQANVLKKIMLEKEA